jgi:hypothetical protein
LSPRVRRSLIQSRAEAPRDRRTAPPGSASLQGGFIPEGPPQCAPRRTRRREITHKSASPVARLSPGDATLPSAREALPRALRRFARCGYPMHGSRPSRNAGNESALCVFGVGSKFTFTAREPKSTLSGSRGFGPRDSSLL